MQGAAYTITSVVLLAVSGASGQPQFVITDLGGAGNLGFTIAYGINDHGQVVGEFSPLFGGETPFLWEDGGMIQLELLPGDSYGQACAINSAGQVTGESGGSAFLWEAGVVIDLGFLPGATNAYALDINDAGQVTGYSGDTVDGDPPIHAFTWEDGSMTDLGSPEKFQSTFGHGINILGHVVGKAYLVDSADHHAVLYSEGLWIDLGVLPGDTKSEANDINDLGQVVGWSREGTGPRRGCIWLDGQPSELLPPPGYAVTKARGINNAGQVVGSSIDGESPYRALLWESDTGEVYVLNDLVETETPWENLQHALDINESGQIAGYGKNPDGDTHAYLLTPIIEPLCDGDVNDDGVVDPLDTGFVMARFGCDIATGDPNCDSADTNADGVVDPLDVGFILSRFGQCS